MRPDGILDYYVGADTPLDDSEGAPRRMAELFDVGSIDVSPDGHLTMVDGDRIRYVDSEERVRTLAGGGTRGGGWPAERAFLDTPSHVAFGPDGGVYIATYDDARVQRFTSAGPGFSLDTHTTASRDGREIYSFDSTGRHLQTMEARTGVTLWTFEYDADGRLATITDRDGAITLVDRDTSGEATAIISPDGLVTQLDVAPEGYLETVTNPAGEGTGFTYTADGLLTNMLTPRGDLQTFEYDSKGRLEHDEDPEGGSQTLARTDVQGSFTVSRTTAMGRETTYERTRLPSGDEVRTVTQPDGTSSVEVFTSLEAVEATFADGTERIIEPSPDPRFGLQAPQSTVTTTTPGGLTLVQARSREVTLSDPNNPLSLLASTDTTTINGRTYTTTYDATTDEQVVTSPEGREVITTFDPQGRPETIQVGNLAPVQFGYDTRGRLVSTAQSDGVTSRSMGITYDTEGFVGSVTDSLGRVTSYEYDLAGRVTRQVLPDLREIVFSYDANGNLTSLTPPSRPAHGFTYDAVNRMTTYDPPVLPDVSVPATTYEYNLDGQVELVTKPGGESIDYVYDPVSGRLVELITPRGSYGFIHNAGGRVETVTDPDGGSITLSYDAGLVLAETWVGPITGSVSRTFDNNLQISAESVNGVFTTPIFRDADGYMTQIGDETLVRDPVTRALTSTTVGDVTLDIGHAVTGEPDALTYDLLGSALYGVSYTRDSVGRIESKSETIGGVTSTRCYEYDTDGRLAFVFDGVDGTGCVGSLVEEYRYDANSNRVYGMNSMGTVDESQVIIDNQDRMLAYGATTFDYNEAGDLESRSSAEGTTTYDYDVLGGLRNVVLSDGREIEYVIDGRGRRTGKQVKDLGEVEFTLVQGFLYRDQFNPIAELDGSGSVVSRFVYGSRDHVPDYMVSGGVTYRLVTDYVGSVVAVVDVASGTIVQRIEYDTWGRVLSDSNPGFQPFGFAGGLYDADTGFVRFGARDYDPSIGRWTTKDEHNQAESNMDLYVYAKNDPVNRIDVDGRSSDPLCEMNKQDPNAFCDEEDAVEAFCKNYGRQTYRGGLEWCTGIRKDTWCYGPFACWDEWTFDDPPKGGTNHSCDALWPGAFSKCHTHPKDVPDPTWPDDFDSCGDDRDHCWMCYNDEPQEYPSERP